MEILQSRLPPAASSSYIALMYPRLAFLVSAFMTTLMTAGELSAAVAQPASSETVTCDFPANSASAPYMRAASPADGCAWTAVTPSGDMTVLDSQGRRLASERGLIHAAALSPDGEVLAYVATRSDESATRLVVDGVDITDTKAADLSPRYDERGRLYWLRSELVGKRPREEIISVCTLDDGSELCAATELHLADLLDWDEGLLAVGFDPDTFEYVAAEVGFDAQAKSPTVTVRLRQPIAALGGRAWSLNLRGNVHRHAFSYFAAYGPQWGEPFSRGSNAHGRVGWTQSYRLRTLSGLARNTGDPALEDAVRVLVSDLLDRADGARRFPARRYSDNLEWSTWAVLDGVLYDALWEAYPLLDDAEQAHLTDYTHTMLEDILARHWTKDGLAWKERATRRRLIGPMPFNQQNAPGLVMIDWMRATGRDDYRDHVRTLYDNLMASVMETDGGPAWPYWPAEHFSPEFAGPSRHIDNPEDVSHASINMEFAVHAADYLGADLPIDPDGLVRDFTQNSPEGQRFHHYLGAGLGRFQPSVTKIPALLFAAQPSIAGTFERWLQFARPDANHQAIHSAYAEALVPVDELSGRIRAYELQPTGTHRIDRVERLDVVIGGNDGTDPVTGLRQATCRMTGRCAIAVAGAVMEN